MGGEPVLISVFDSLTANLGNAFLDGNEAKRPRERCDGDAALIPAELTSLEPRCCPAPGQVGSLALGSHQLAQMGLQHASERENPTRLW